MTSDDTLILEARNLRFAYSSGLLLRRESALAVDDVSLQLRRKDVLAVIGESGCGKTTLSRLLLGLERPAGGEILLGGRPLAQHGRREIARRMQVVFQDPYSALNPRHTVGRIVQRPLEIHGVGTSEERRKAAREILDVVGLPARFFDTLPGHLSGGQRQRVVIARALVLRPEILVCDEPTSALDVSVQAQILNLLLDLRSEFGLSYVLISHNLAVVEHMATRLAIMYLGRVVETGAPEAIFHHPRHPYTRALLRSMITPDPRAGIPEVRMVRDGARERASPQACRFYARCSEALPQCRADPPPHIERPEGLVECHLATNPDPPHAGQVIRLNSEQHASPRET